MAATLGRRRALGQHFLKDQTVIQQIVDTALSEADRLGSHRILEIGPGKGALTYPLLQGLEQRAGGVTAGTGLKNLLLVERDRFLAENWKKESASRNLKSSFSWVVEEGDFLQLPEPRWLDISPLAVVSNLPYSSGTAILNRLVSFRDAIPVMVLMFQAEVAKRLRAEPSTPARGSLSLWIQNGWEVKSLLTVPPRAFSPPPQVNSEVVVLLRKDAPEVPGTLDPRGSDLWESLLKICFSQRRKMLRSSLHSRQPWQNALEQSGVDGTKRAEALNWKEWDQLFQAVCRLAR